MRDRRGFTLLEIIVVITIVGIMAIIATTNFFSWQNHYGVVGFQRELLSKVNEARTRSVAVSLQHQLLIERSSGSIKVTLRRWDLGTGPWVNVPGPIVQSSAAVIDNVACTPTITVPSTFALLFKPDGEVLFQTVTSGTAASPLTQADIHISATSVADQATVRVFGWTSKARLFNGWN